MREWRRVKGEGDGVRRACYWEGDDVARAVESSEKRMNVCVCGGWGVSVECAREKERGVLVVVKDERLDRSVVGA